MSNGIYVQPQPAPIDAANAVTQVVTVVRTDGTTVLYDLVAFADLIISCDTSMKSLSAQVRERSAEVERLGDRITYLEDRNQRLQSALRTGMGMTEDDEDDRD